MADNETGGNASLHQLRGRLLGQFLSVIRFTPLGIGLGQNLLSNNPVSNKITQGINDAVRDTVRDSIAGMTWLKTDKATANKCADQVEQFWRNNINRYDPRLGQAEFRMASGWKIPPGMSYNGVIDPKKDNQEISRMDAVFYRNKEGHVEVLDARDPRWTNLVAPYIAAQIMVPTYAAKAVGAAVSAIGNGNKLAQFTAHATTIGKVAGGTHTAGGVGFGGSTVYSNFILKPEAIDRIGRILEDPNKMRPDILREELNKVFEQYSYLNGPMSEQYFVPLIKQGEDPLRRLEDLSRGILKGVFESKDPFDRIDPKTSPKTDIQLTDSRNEVKNNHYFLRGFYKLSIKAISGELMTETETLAFKTGMNIYFGRADSLIPEKSNRQNHKEEMYKLLEKFRILYEGNDFEFLKGARFDSKASIANQEILDLLKSQLKGTDLIISTKDLPKNPIIQNRIDSPFVPG